MSSDIEKNVLRNELRKERELRQKLERSLDLQKKKIETLKVENKLLRLNNLGHSKQGLEDLKDPEGNPLLLQLIKNPVFSTGAQELSNNETEQVKERERIQQHQEEVYRLQSESSRDIISLFDLTGKNLYTSPACELVLGFSQRELIGSSFYEMLHPDDVDRVTKEISRAVIEDNQGANLQFKYLRKDGSYVWLEAGFKRVIENDLVVKVLASSRDITTRKMSQEALKRSEKKYKNLIKYSKAYIFAHDLEGHLLSANPSFCAMVGSGEEDLLQKSLGEIITVASDEALTAYLQQFKTKVYQEGIFEVNDKNSKRHYIIYDSFLVEEVGSMPYVVCNAQDITYRILMEKKLKKANEVAEASVRQNENFLAAMSHEIRTPMHGILGIAELFSKTTLNESQQNYLNIIREAADNLLIVVNDILDFSKIKEGMLEIEHIPFELNEVLPSAYKVLALKAEEKGVQFNVNAVSINVPLIGDPYRLNQILQNLLSNAIKFTEAGTITLTCEIIKETSAEISIQFAIRDTGIGIPRNNQEQIFKDFSQASSDITRKFGGTGLGLSICKRLVDMQNGRLWLESEPGKGSTFKFILTFKKFTRCPIVIEKQEAIDFASLGKLRVLLAEDDKINIMLAQKHMSRWGFESDVALTGKEAVTLLEKNDYDIILMDVQMPVLSGIEATKTIRKFADRKKAGTPIIAITANAMKSDGLKYLELGMDDYLSKPFSEEKLFLKIAKQFAVNPGKQASSGVSNELQRCKPVVLENLTTALKLKTCDLTYLSSIAEGDIAYMKEMILTFIEQSSQELNRIQEAIISNEKNVVKHAAHKLKSSAGMVGAITMRNLLKTIEEQANSGSGSEELRKLNDQVIITFKRATKELKQVLSEL